MPSNLPNANPVSYLGVRANTPPNFVKIGRAPTILDSKGATGPYRLGDFWLDTSTATMWVYVDNVLGDAIWDKFAGLTAGIDTLTGDSGGAVGPTAGNVDILGGVNMEVVGTPASSLLTLNATGNASFSWIEVTVTGPTQMAVNRGYIANNVGLVQLLLPATSAVGDILRVVGKGTGGWQITQNAGQSLRFINFTSAVGVGGSTSSTQDYNAIELVCTTANTVWTLLSQTGNLGVV